MRNPQNQIPPLGVVGFSSVFILALLSVGKLSPSLEYAITLFILSISIITTAVYVKSINNNSPNKIKVKVEILVGRVIGGGYFLAFLGFFFIVKHLHSFSAYLFLLVSLGAAVFVLKFKDFVDALNDRT
ncbi:TPA: hypothetical protein NG287_002325 [Vibrio parahaemolyticus]|nr:hypothetical protein [Vibrio parahaemolyticus]HCG7349998.1 hypothetical protein [Vibrio parahaemolyticus]